MDFLIDDEKFLGELESQEYAYEEKNYVLSNEVMEDLYDMLRSCDPLIDDFDLINIKNFIILKYSVIKGLYYSKENNRNYYIFYTNVLNSYLTLFTNNIKDIIINLPEYKLIYEINYTITIKDMFNTFLSLMSFKNICEDLNIPYLDLKNKDNQINYIIEKCDKKLIEKVYFNFLRIQAYYIIDKLYIRI